MPSEKVSTLSPSYSWIRPSHSVNWSKKFCASRISTRLHDSHEDCCVSSSCVGLVLRLDSSPSRDAVMFLSASDQSQCFLPDCVHQEIVQLFRTEHHLKSELCNRFLCRPSECALHHRFQIRHGRHRLNDERPIAPLCVATREGWTLAHHARIHLPCGCHCRSNSCSLGFCCQSLSFSELLAHFRLCLGQLLHRCHVRSARQVHTRTDRRHSALNGAPLPCCKVWVTIS